MSSGFLGNDASLMLDAVVCLLVLVVPVLAVSLYAVRFRRRFRRHRQAQIAIGAVLLVAVVAFEVDLQLVHGGWINIVNKSPNAPRLTGERLDDVRQILRIHLVFAISTPLLWGATTWLAVRRFTNPPAPGRHSRLHRWLGWFSVVDLVLTSLTGLAFYYAAFMRD